MRIGNGYDVHKLVTGRKLILGGVTIPYEKGLLGHSDSDVLVHAIMDALLGAAGLFDIGYYFPDTDDEFKDISSLTLLKRVNEMIKQEGLRIENIDSIIIAERPKLKDYIDLMKENICHILEIDKGQIGIKATTEEALGFTGEGLGIKATAVCLLK